ncbi:hypothetical protein [Ochrobactrum sp. Marseille-Q0166]|uniref:hypothetical protein n=1 Tax=Ochrobactrum sp. Marseille-Q0166 TaxID=2761105 RepID=UPI001656370C|nr:hypothetical protein [Ochrobactrum sp. Marseille-Q0166]MBC8717955.1 hypothetical protein [Ochrobactrum sp. Marseille-Q0166]
MLKIFCQKTFWKKTLWWTWKVYEFLCVTIVTILSLRILFLLAVYLTDSFILPNGMIVKREFYGSIRQSQSNLYASDGKTRLATRISSMCFNDRYIKVRSSGVLKLIDGETNRLIPLSDHEARRKVDPSGSLNDDCNGYYKDWVSPNFLYVTNRDRRVPRCDRRNFDNPNLKNLEWFEKRRCRSR